jgi:hypothetical protein
MTESHFRFMATSNSKDVEDMTLTEIESLNKNFDYRSFLENSEAMKGPHVNVSSFELESGFSVRIDLALEKDFFDISPKESEQLIRGLLRFSKLHILKRNTDGRTYKVVEVTQHSKKTLEVKLELYEMENIVLKNLPIQIHGFWSDLLDRI